MPAKSRPGMRGVYIELPESLDAEVRALAERLHSGFAEQVRLALRRHLDSPPVLTLPGLEPAAACPPPEESPPKPARPRGRPRKQSPA